MTNALLLPNAFYTTFLIHLGLDKQGYISTIKFLDLLLNSWYGPKSKVENYSIFQVKKLTLEETTFVVNMMFRINQTKSDSRNEFITNIQNPR